MMDAIYLFKGHTRHKRYQPMEHAFRYGLTLIDLDVDQLEAADGVSSIFSIDRHNWVSFDSGSRGSLGEQPLGTWARRTFENAGISSNECQIRLLTFPRTEFYSFAPISVWLLLDRNETLRGLIYEVNNTFGERHSYVARAEGHVSRHEAQKSFHVSPFFDVTGSYRFSVKNEEDRFSLTIENIVDGEITHIATLSGERHKATTSRFIALLLASPFSGFGVTLAIHWEALKLWLKGAKYRSKPPVPDRPITKTRSCNEAVAACKRNAQ